jgi:predicted dehydrogenase
MINMQEFESAKVAMIGCGVISKAYLTAGLEFQQYKIVSCADLFPEAARQRAADYNLKAVSIDEVFDDPSIEIILNLTTPQSHAAITKRAIEAGKHVYQEKPLGLTLEETRPLLDLAARANRRIGCAPDTILGGGFQTARKILDDGLIGRPIGGTAYFMSPGPETWHPNGDFLYKRGAGPVFDMGPYYLTSLVQLLGPIDRVFACGQISRAERMIGSGPRQGEKFVVEVPTFVTALLAFSSGASVQFGISFDVIGHEHKPIEIYGIEGSLQIPDPNTFGGNVRLMRSGFGWQDMPHTHGYDNRNWRGIGLAEMVEAIRSGLPHRTSAEVAFHVLEVMEQITEVAVQGGERKMDSTCDRPRPLSAASVISTLQ